MSPFKVFNCRCMVKLYNPKETEVSEVYKSSTDGSIPLSFTGRHLLASEREAVQTAIKNGDFNTQGQRLSRVRAQLARRMSELEEQVRNLERANENLKVQADVIRQQSDKKGYERGYKAAETLLKRTRVEDNVVNLLDAGFEVSLAMNLGRYEIELSAVVTAEQAQRVGDHMMRKHQREDERANAKINIVNVRDPFSDLADLNAMDADTLANALFGFREQEQGLAYFTVTWLSKPNQYKDGGTIVVLAASQGEAIALAKKDWSHKHPFGSTSSYYWHAARRPA